MTDNAFICVTGATQVGKSSVLAALCARYIVLSAIGNSRSRFQWENAPRALRMSRWLSPSEEERSPLYVATLLVLDDLDKTDPKYRALARDVIVHRDDMRLSTLIAATNLADLKAFDPQVYERVMHGKIIQLKRQPAQDTLSFSLLNVQAQQTSNFARKV